MRLILKLDNSSTVCCAEEKHEKYYTAIWSLLTLLHYIHMHKYSAELSCQSTTQAAVLCWQFAAGEEYLALLCVKLFFYSFALQRPSFSACHSLPF